MDTNSYSFKTLEEKYGGFFAPAFTVSIDSTNIDSTKVPISSLTVDIDAGASAGGCRFVIDSLYDYESGSWLEDLLEKIDVGKTIEIEAGYVEKKRIFYGFVDDYSIEYTTDSGPQLSVSGIDAKGFLMNAKSNRYMNEESTKDIITGIFDECRSIGYAEEMTVGDIEDFKAQLIKDEIDDYKFLCFLAEMFNMQFMVIDGEIIFDDTMSNTSSLMTLTMGVNLLNFSKTMSLKKQVGKIVVHGIDPETKKPISGEAEDTSFGEFSGGEPGDKIEGFDDVVETENSSFVSTPEECQRLAQARFDARIMNFVKGKGKCLGIPELIPGRYIEIDGIDPESSSKYFVTKVTHEYSSEQGYFTSFEIKGAKSQ